jgi:hypothetical protein
MERLEKAGQRMLAPPEWCFRALNELVGRSRQATIIMTTMRKSLNLD